MQPSRLPRWRSRPGCRGRRDACTTRYSGVGGKLDDPGREGIQLRLPPGEFLAALRQAALRFGDPIAAFDQPASVFRGDRVGKPCGGQRLAPTSSHGLERLLRLVRPACGDVGVLLGGGTFGVLDSDCLQGRQFVFRGLKPADDRSSAARQLGI